MNRKPPLLKFQLMNAICSDACTLRPALRHLLLVMAHLSDGPTGRGYSSQETIAKAMGMTDRAVRKLLAELEAMGAESPIHVTRRARFKGGRGRTSDEYSLRIREIGLTGTVVPVEDAEGDHDQPEQIDGLTGTELPTNRNGGSGDQVSDKVRDKVCNSSPKNSAQGKPSSSSNKGQRKAEAPVKGAFELSQHYASEFERTRSDRPEFGKDQTRAMKAFGEIVTRHGLEAGKRVVTNCLDADRTYHRKINPWEIATDSNKWLTQPPTPLRKAPVAVQAGGLPQDLLDAAMG